MNHTWLPTMTGVALCVAALAASGCGSDDDDGGAGSAGYAGATGGTGGTSGAAGTSGTGGSSGTAGAAGTGGSAGSAGAAGTGGSAGSAGASGAGGSSGSAGAGNASFDLSFEGADFSPHDGQVLRVVLINSGDETVEKEEAIVVSGGSFSFSWPGALQEGSAYHLDYFADFNANGQCDAPSADHTWRETIPAVSDDVSISIPHNTNFVDVCSSFTTTSYDISFGGAGFGPHDGQTLSMALVRTDTGLVVARDGVQVSGGAFSFDWGGLLLDGVPYRVDYYADFNENGQCDPPSADHVWSVDLGLAEADVTQQVSHSTDFTDVCASFP